MVITFGAIMALHPNTTGDLIAGLVIIAIGLLVFNAKVTFHG
jgi:hypothetical protein